MDTIGDVFGQAGPASDLDGRREADDLRADAAGRGFGEPGCAALRREHNLVFTWLRDPRFAGTAEDETPSFLPVEVVGAAPAPAVRAAAEGRVEIDLAGGVRLRVVGGYDPEALARLIRGLSG